MKSLYIITIKNDQGAMSRHRLVASTKATAVARAQELAGVDEETETESEQRMEFVDEVLD